MSRTPYDRTRELQRITREDLEAAALSFRYHYWLQLDGAPQNTPLHSEYGRRGGGEAADLPLQRVG
jgi:hypothetical protein